jgi:hypothetical protein
MNERSKETNKNLSKQFDLTYVYWKSVEAGA